MKLIELDAALDAFKKELTEGKKRKYVTSCSAIGYEGAKHILESLPTVDAVPVRHGRWQWISSTYDRVPCEKRYWCSKCHHETITHDSEPWEKFCPNCGARMNGKGGDTDGV